MLNFVTLFDKNYLSRGLVLLQSLNMCCKETFTLYILAMDEKVQDYFDSKQNNNVVCFNVDDLITYYPVLSKLRKERTRGEFCWTLSSFSIQYVIKKYNVDECTYLDSDLCFWSDPKNLLDEMGEASVLITEHNYSSDCDTAALTGKYCVQFMCFKNNPDGNRVLEWWRSKCEEWCFNRMEDGKFGDQKYLDDWESRFEGIVYNCRTIGCGLAPWNCQKYKIKKEGNDIYIIDKISLIKKQLVFYHFHNLRKIIGERWSLSNYMLTKDVIPLYCFYIRQIKRIEALLPDELVSNEYEEKTIHEKHRFIRSMYGGIKHVFYLYKKISQTKYNIIKL